MALFKSDIPVHRQLILQFSLIGWVAFGFIVAFFFSNTTVYVVTGVLAVTILVEYIDMSGRELDRLANIGSIAMLAVGFVTLWITALSVNGWWTNIIPAAVLR